MWSYKERNVSCGHNIQMYAYKGSKINYFYSYVPYSINIFLFSFSAVMVDFFGTYQIMYILYSLFQLRTLNISYVHNYLFYLNISVKIPKLVHFRERFDATPAVIGEEFHRTRNIWNSRESKEKIQFCRINLVILKKYLKSDLRYEGKLVPFEETTGGVHENGVSDAVDEVLDPFF